MLAHRNFNVVDQLPQNVRHGRALALAQDAVLIEEQITDDFDKIAPRCGRSVASQTQQRVDVEDALGLAFR